MLIPRYFIINYSTDSDLPMDPPKLAVGTVIRSKLPIQLSKKKATLFIKKDQDLTMNQLEDMMKENCIIMSEQEYDYLNEDRAEAPRLCCERFLVMGSLVTQPESTKYEFKMFCYPFNSEQNETIQRTMVSFLNSDGGYIFIGIKETEDKKRLVVGMNLCEAEKEQIYKDIRHLAQSIQPGVTRSRMVDTVFVPTKYGLNSEKCIPGRYVIKVTISQGNPRELYQIKTSTNATLCYFRYQDECIAISKDHRQEEINKRKLKSGYIPKVHECLKPLLGQPIFKSMNIKPDAHQGSIRKIACSYTFQIVKETNISKIKTFIGDIRHNIIFLGNRTTDCRVVRLELTRDVEDIDIIIESYGGKIILIQREREDNMDEGAENQKQKVELKSEKKSNGVVIEGWNDQNTEDNKGNHTKILGASKQIKNPYQNQSLKNQEQIQIIDKQKFMASLTQPRNPQEQKQNNFNKNIKKPVFEITNKPVQQESYLKWTDLLSDHFDNKSKEGSKYNQIDF